MNHQLIDVLFRAQINVVWLQGRGSARRGKLQSTSVPRILTIGKKLVLLKFG